MNDICLIVAFYCGKREYGQENNYENYLNLQKKILLEKVSHNLSNIIFVISRDDLGESETIVEVEGKITYFYRKNKNLSFGAWIDAMNTFEHKYYILSEDDYLFTKNNFEKILLENYLKSNSDYLVTWLQKPKGMILQSTIGILSCDKRYLFEKYNDNSHDKDNAMSSFLSRVKVSGLQDKNLIFPYSYAEFDNIIMFTNNSNDYNVDTDYSKTPHLFLNAFCFDENIDYDTNNMIVCCYQFVEKYMDKLFNTVENQILANDNETLTTLQVTDLNE